MEQNIKNYIIGGVIGLGVLAGWGTVATIKSVNNANERDQVKQEKIELDRRRVEQYNDLVRRHNTNLETLNNERAERKEEVGTLTEKLNNKTYQVGLTTEQRDSLSNELNKQIIAYDSLSTLVNKIKEERADLKNTVTNYQKRKEELKLSLADKREELRGVKQLKRDSMDLMQESIYGLLASPFWTRAPRLDRNEIPPHIRFIPFTKDDVTRYREMNREYGRKADN